MNSELDPELEFYYKIMFNKIKQEQIEYLKTKPEIREILIDFITKLFLHKPESIYEFSKEHFMRF